MAVPSSGTLNQKGLAQECLSGYLMDQGVSVVEYV